METIKLTIQEIVNDFYSLAETEGYISGLAESGNISDKYLNEYHNCMVNLINKYIPNWKNKVDNKYWENNITKDEKGLILSSILTDNFKKMFYELV